MSITWLPIAYHFREDTVKKNWKLHDLTTFLRLSRRTINKWIDRAKAEHLRNGGGL